MRLSKDDREAIIRRVIAGTLQPEYLSICAKLAPIADVFWEEGTPSFIRERGDDGWFPQVFQILIQYDGTSSGIDNLQFNGGFHFGYGVKKFVNDPDNVYRPVRYKHHQGVFMAFDINVRRYYGIMQEVISIKKDFIAKHTDAITKVRSIVYSASSTEHLYKLWPEVEPYLPTPPVKHLPALPISDVNTLLGLLQVVE